MNRAGCKIIGTLQKQGNSVFYANAQIFVLKLNTDFPVNIKQSFTKILHILIYFKICVLQHLLWSKTIRGP